MKAHKRLSGNDACASLDEILNSPNPGLFLALLRSHQEGSRGWSLRVLLCHSSHVWLQEARKKPKLTYKQSIVRFSCTLTTFKESFLRHNYPVILQLILSNPAGQLSPFCIKLESCLACTTWARVRGFYVCSQILAHSARVSRIHFSSIIFSRCSTCDHCISANRLHHWILTPTIKYVFNILEC